MERIIEDLEAQVAYANQKIKDKTFNDEWNAEYSAGYVDGLKQAVACLKLSI